MVTADVLEKTEKTHKPKWLMEPDLPDPEIMEKLAELEALELPDSDGEPMENNRERIQINLGLDCLDYAWRDRNDYYAGGNMFVYFNIEQARMIMDEIEAGSRLKRIYRGPDLFVVLNVDGGHRRQKWVTWQEEGRYPDLIIEFLSPSTREKDLHSKKTLYEDTFRTHEYFCFDYLNPDAFDSLLGWRLDEHGHYQPLMPDKRGWMWSETLQLWIGRWHGTVARDQTTWLRFYTPEGDLVLTKAEAEELRAAAEQQRAVLEQQRAALEEQRADAEQQRADAEQQRADAEQQRADEEAAARQAAEAENARLRAELARLRGETA